MIRRLLLSLCAVCTAVALCVTVSCDEVIIGEEDSGEVSGNLQVTVFQIERTPFASLTRAAQPASEVCSRLNYAIYTLDGTRLKQVNKMSGDAAFHTASFQLDEGDYVLVVVGHSSGGNPTMTDPSCIKFTNAQGYTDTFVSCTMVTIADEAVDCQVSLDRITSLCRFVITDAYPPEVKKMRFYYTGGSGAFDAATGYGSVNSKQDVKFDIASGQKQFDLYTFLHDDEGTVHLTVTALDASGAELYSREFDVPMQQNYITWVSGAFFDGGSGAAGVTSVTVNTDWAGETHITF